MLKSIEKWRQQKETKRTGGKKTERKRHKEIGKPGMGSCVLIMNVGKLNHNLSQ